MTIQQATELTHAAMLGLGVYRPERVVTNDEICEVLDSNDEWIQTRSGIKTRRFADDLSDHPARKGEWESASFRDAAESAVSTIAAVYEGWGPKVNKRIRSGSPANEIIKAAKQYDAGLIVVAAGGRGLSDSVLMGSTAQRVQHYAPCPVLVVRPAPRVKKGRKAKAKAKA